MLSYLKNVLFFGKHSFPSRMFPFMDEAVLHAKKLFSHRMITFSEDQSNLAELNVLDFEGCNRPQSIFLSFVRISNAFSHDKNLWCLDYYFTEEQVYDGNAGEGATLRRFCARYSGGTPIISTSNLLSLRYRVNVPYKYRITHCMVCFTNRVHYITYYYHWKQANNSHN